MVGWFDLMVGQYGWLVSMIGQVVWLVGWSVSDQDTTIGLGIFFGKLVDWLICQLVGLLVG